MGIGYDENESWLEKYDRIYNDAVKNVKVESHGHQVSLSVVDDTDTSHSGNTLGEKTLKEPYHYKQLVEPENISTCKKDLPRCTAPNLNTIFFDNIKYETECNRVLSGKLKRIEEQDRLLEIHFNNSVQKLNKTLSGEYDMAYRKTNVESDMEEKEHEGEIDNNESVLQSAQSEEGRSFDFRSKSTKKRERKRMNKLTRQLGICNLEENSVKNESLSKTKKLRQKMKSKEKKIDSSTVEFVIKDMYEKLEQCPSKHKTDTPGLCPSKKHKRDTPDVTCNRLRRFFDEESKINEAVNYSPNMEKNLRGIMRRLNDHRDY